MGILNEKQRYWGKRAIVADAFRVTFTSRLAPAPVFGEYFASDIF